MYPENPGWSAPRSNGELFNWLSTSGRSPLLPSLGWFGNHPSLFGSMGADIVMEAYSWKQSRIRSWLLRRKILQDIARAGRRELPFTGMVVVPPCACRGLWSDWMELEGSMLEVVLKRFDQPDEVRAFERGKFELVHIGGMTIGRAIYQPGWKWSVHVGRALGKSSCDVEHVGLVLSGRAIAAMDDGRVIEMKAGDLFYIAPGHDSWVVGEEPYVSLHLVGGRDYAAHKT
jgi:hypothetical protein